MSVAHKSLRERAEEAKTRVLEILGVDDHSHDEEMVKAIEAIIIEALLEERERCATVAYDHVLPEDRDKAHKVADEIKRIRNALAANLDSLR